MIVSASIGSEMVVVEEPSNRFKCPILKRISESNGINPKIKNGISAGDLLYLLLAGTAPVATD